METEFFKTRYDLTEFCVRELARNRRSNYREHFISRVAVTVFEYFYSVGNERFIRNRAERALINARAAGYALFVIYLRLFIRSHRNSLYFAGEFARAFVVSYRAVRAYLGACAAFFTLGFVDMRNVVVIELNRAETAGVLATVRKTAAARAGNLVSAYGTFVAGDVDDFYNILIVFVAAHGKFYAFG